jgi:hypothetical protein
MAGNLREFAMPAAVPAATPAGSKKMPDSQEALYKRMRLEPIGTRYLSKKENDRLDVLLVKATTDYASLTQKEKVEYEVLRFFNDKYISEDEPAGDAQRNEILKFLRNTTDAAGIKQIWLEIDKETVHDDTKAYKATQLRKLFIQAKYRVFRSFNQLYNAQILPVPPQDVEPDSDSDLSSAQNAPKPVVQTQQQPKPTSSTTEQGSTTPRDANPRLLLDPHTSSSSTPAAATTATTPQKPEVKHLEADLDLVLRSGLQPLYSFIGMVGASLGDQDVRSYYKWRGAGASMDELQSPVAKGAANLEEFVRRNSHLGRPLLRYALEIGIDATKKGKMLAAQIGEQMIPAVIQDERYIMDLIDGSYVNKTPNAAEAQWTWGAIDEAVLAYILQDSALGAIHLAHSVIKSIPRCWDFTLKELLMSDGVNAMFAKFVGWEFLQASGGNAYGRSSSSTSRGMVKGSTFMLSAGFATRQALYAQVAVAKIWFEDVRRISNPLKTELDAFIAATAPLVDAYESANPLRPPEAATLNGLRKLFTLINEKKNANWAHLDAYVNQKINLFIAQEKARYMPPYVLRHCE